MPSLYEITVPVFIAEIKILQKILAKGVAYANLAESKVSEQDLLDARLVADMQNFIYQSTSCLSFHFIPHLCTQLTHPAFTSSILNIGSQVRTSYHILPCQYCTMYECLYIACLQFPRIILSLKPHPSHKIQILCHNLLWGINHLTDQPVQRLSDTAKGLAVRVGKVENVVLSDDEKTFADLQARLAKTVEVLESVKVRSLSQVK